MRNEKRREAIFERVSFVVARDRMDAIVSALEAYVSSGASDELAAVQAAAAAERQARWTHETVPFGDERTLLLELLAGDPLEAMVRGAGPQVRRVILAQALEYARVLDNLRKNPAPPYVLESARALLVEPIHALDPASPMREAVSAELFELDGTFVTHVWLERVLEDSRDPLTVSCTRFRTEEPPGLDEISIEALGMRPGLEECTVFARSPSRELWCPPAVTLGRVLDEGKTVVGECGGPMTYAFAGDPVASTVHPSIAERALALEANQALVAFLWRDVDLGEAWGERP